MLTALHWLGGHAAWLLFAGVSIGLLLPDLAALAWPLVLPITFLLLRFAVVLAFMLPIALLFRAPWPASPWQVAHIAVAGVLAAK